MALISRLPSGGIDNSFKKENLISYRGKIATTPTLQISVEHTNTSTAVLLGTIISSAAWVIPYAKVVVSHGDKQFMYDSTWYELRDKHNNVICTFTGNLKQSGTGSTTEGITSLRFVEGENYLYFCSHFDNGLYGGTVINLNCNYEDNLPYLSGTGKDPTLTWKKA